MNKTAITIAAMICATAAVIAHWNATAGPLDPPPSAFDAPGVPGSTAPSLGDLADQIQASSGGFGDESGLLTAGVSVGGITTNYAPIVAGSGIIRKIIVNHTGSAAGTSGVEIRIDGNRYGGYYRPTMWSGGTGSDIGFQPVYDVAIRFDSGVEVRGFSSAFPQAQSIVLLYEPTP